MGRLIEELDYRATAMGPLILRRRWVAAIDADVIEVILGEEHLMSSLFTVGETELAVRGLAAAEGGPLRVLVGGLGLGYTARAGRHPGHVSRCRRRPGPGDRMARGRAGTAG
jgi:hypothetical protein